MDEALLQSQIESLIATTERLSGLHITVHEAAGIRESLPLKSRHGHLSPFCQAGRETIPGYDRRCQEHCRYALKDRVAEVRSSFVHTCWKGGAEACAPVFRDGQHQLTVFGGITQAASAPPTGLDPIALRAWRALPAPDAERLAAAIPVLVAVGHGILALADEARHSSTDHRRALIERFIDSRLHQPVTITQLATHLDLSASRTAHVVREQCGESFGACLLARRLARAKRLLQTTDDTVGTISKHCGFGNQHWFSRLFTRHAGNSPGRWRATHRPQA